MAQPQLLLDQYKMQWDTVPAIFLDTETTGTRVGFDRCCQVAIVRFENGEPVDQSSALINPGIPIPLEVTEIHGITDDMVKDAITIGDFFAHPRTIKLIEGAQAGAYNGPFDKHFVPPFGLDWTWPWLDGLTLVRKVDRYARGPGRHKLAAVCERHEVELPKAHDAVSDARSAGLLFYKLGRKTFPKYYSLGQVLGWQRRTEAEEWIRFYNYVSSQPPKTEAQP